MSATVVIDTTSRIAVLELRLYPHGGMSALAGASRRDQEENAGRRDGAQAAAARDLQDDRDQCPLRTTGAAVSTLSAADTFGSGTTPVGTLDVVDPCPLNWHLITSRGT